VITVTRIGISIESQSSKTPYASFGTIMSDKDLIRLDVFPPTARKDNPLPGDAAAFTELRQNVDRHRFGELSAHVRHGGTAKVPDLRHPGIRVRTNALRRMQQKDTSGLQLQGRGFCPSCIGRRTQHPGSFDGIHRCTP